MGFVRQKQIGFFMILCLGFSQAPALGDFQQDPEGFQRYPGDERELPPPPPEPQPIPQIPSVQPVSPPVTPAPSKNFQPVPTAATATSSQAFFPGLKVERVPLSGSSADSHPSWYWYLRGNDLSKEPAKKEAPR